MKTFGERLRYVRDGISQAAFAGTLGIPQTTLSNYERNKNEPDFALIDRICTAFRVNPEWLLFGRGPVRSDETTPEDNKKKEAAERARCAALENELRLERERRKMSEALVESLTKNLALLEENNRLRLENTKKMCRETRHADGRSVTDEDAPPTFFDEQHTIRCSESHEMRGGFPCSRLPPPSGSASGG